MDTIWWKATKNIRKCEERLAATAATTTTPIYTNLDISALMEENMNTVKKNQRATHSDGAKLGENLIRPIP